MSGPSSRAGTELSPTRREARARFLRAVGGGSEPKRQHLRGPHLLAAAVLGFALGWSETLRRETVGVATRLALQALRTG